MKGAVYDLASAFAGQIHAAEAEKGKVYEAVIGVVTDNKDPSKLGRVKVKFPVISETDTSWWSPIVMLGAGKNRGWFFIPERDDEVLCIFEHGDITRPVVVGALWNGKDKPSDKNDGNNERRVIKSRQGNKITFDDDKMQIVIEDGGGNGKISFDSNSNKITIEALKGDVCFQSPSGTMTIVAKSAVLKATSNLEIHAGAAMSWGTDAGVKLNAGDVTISGATANANCGSASAPAAPTANPQDVKDPYGS